MSKPKECEPRMRAAMLTLCDLIENAQGDGDERDMGTRLNHAEMLAQRVRKLLDPDPIRDDNLNRMTLEEDLRAIEERALRAYDAVQTAADCVEELFDALDPASVACIRKAQVKP